MIHLIVRFLRGVVPRALQHDQFAARQLAREARALTNRDQSIGVAPQDERRRLHARETSAKGVEPELPEHTSQGAPELGQWGRRVVLFDVGCGALTGIRERLAENATCCPSRSEEHTSELQSQSNLVCRLLLEKKKNYHLQLH